MFPYHISFTFMDFTVIQMNKKIKTAHRVECRGVLVRATRYTTCISFSQNTTLKLRMGERDQLIVSHIRKNLDKLVALTDVNVSLTSKLISGNGFSQEDVEILNAIGNRVERAAKLYEIMRMRPEAYHLLIEGLEIGRQTGVLQILNQI
ncbi:unnamed protein product [Orchesella dallaii]|uniref:CARD domain-containing protein n=1 Tax=Orchesella dallaii TaxID=48710 RepID=A0ABP1R681_9HEXA